MFGKFLKKLVSYKIINPSLADICKCQYSKLIRSVTKEYKPKFLSFDKSEQRLDEFLGNCVGNAPSFSELCNVFKILLIFSHGQAHVERGFSVNKQLLVENLHPYSLVAQRIVNDHMVFHKSQHHEVDVNVKMFSHVRQVCTCYLNDQRQCSLKNLRKMSKCRLTTLTMLTRK